MKYRVLKYIFSNPRFLMKVLLMSWRSFITKADGGFVYYSKGNGLNRKWAYIEPVKYIPIFRIRDR